jgi:hypothetical protein
VDLAAVAQIGWALQYVSKELKRNKEVVMVAVAQDVHALQFASYELKED